MTIPRISATAVQEGSVAIGDQTLPIGTFPFVITDVVTGWDAFRRWEPDDLISRYGERPVECFVSDRRKRAFLQQVNRRRAMLFGEFLRHIFGGDADELWYLRVGANEELFRDLNADFQIPPLLPQYNPAATGIWMGQAPNLTPFHHDWWHSCLAQVRGRKEFILVHPFEAKRLQAGWGDAARFDLASPPYLSPDSEVLAELETAVVGTLQSGEILYIPPYWWHQIETVDGGNISMPIRFDTSQSPDVPLFQISQESSLRDITNHPIAEPAALKACLSDNRRRFHRRESEFLTALKATRGVGIDPNDL